MTRMIVDPVTEAELSSVRRTMELSNKSGRILGYFVPALDSSDHAGIEPDITEEELRRREQKGGGRSLTEILADLEKRA